MSSVVAARSLVARLRTTMHKMSYMPHHGIRQIGPASSSSNNTTITPIAYCCHDQFITRQRLFSSVSSKPNPSSSDSTNSTSTKPTTTSTSTSTTDASSSNSDTTTTPVDAETITKQVDALMSEAANRATRYVYLRTLPLSEQSVFSNYTTSDLKSIGDAIETRVRIVLSSQLTKTHHHNNDNSLQITPGSRTAVHVHTAALAVATWHVLHPGWIPDEQRVINMIRRAFGAPVLEEDGMTDEEKLTLNDGLTARLDYWVVRTALWFAFDKMMAVKRMTKNTMSDFGADFKMRVDDGVVGGLEQHILSVGKFFFPFPLVFC